MKRLLLSVTTLVFSLSLLPFAPVSAGECWAEPYYKASGTAIVKSAVYLRSGPCQDGTQVIATATAGATVPVLAENHGWYLVRLENGATGWSYQSFFDAGSLSLTRSSRSEVEAAYPLDGATTKTTEVTQPVSKTESTKSVVSGSFADTVRGRILLQVEQHGEAWYVAPDTLKRYYMKDGPTAYEMMRAFGLGISNADFTRLKAGDQAMNRSLRGKIVLEVERHGEAHYILPTDGSLHYLKDGAEAYRIMRELSLGITDKDLSRVTSTEFTPVPYKDSQAETSSKPSEASDLAAFNQYWLDKVNALRAARGLRTLAIDDRFVATATEWAAYMGENDERGHVRPDGKTMHQWIDAKGLEFTERYSTDGWQTNYFTENVAWNKTDGTLASMKKALAETMSFYLSEEAWNGPHYRTVYHEDWNAVGAGFSLVPNGDGTYTVYMAFHFGSLSR